MTGYRKAAKKSNFTQISNTLAQDNTLSFEARGMLLYLLSKSDDWVGRPRDIEREGDIGNTKRRNLTKEAEKAGYLAYRKTRDSKTGQFDCWYEVHDEPLPCWERTRSWESHLKGHLTGEPPLDSPWVAPPLGGEAVHGEPQGILNTDRLNKDLPKTEVEVGTSATLIQLIQEKTGLLPESAELILERNPDETLVMAALDAWVERIGRIKDATRENPVGFLRGCINDPGAFGIVWGPDGWFYPPALARHKIDRIKSAVKGIQWHRNKGDTDAVAMESMLASGRFDREQVDRAFVLSGGYRG